MHRQFEGACLSQVFLRSVWVQPIRILTCCLWAEPPRPLYSVPAAACFCSNSEVTVGRRLSRGSRLLYTVIVLVKRWQHQYFSLGAFTFMYFWNITAIFGNTKYCCYTLVVWSSSNRTARCIEGRRELFFFLNPFSVGFAGVLLLSCTVPRHFLYQKGETVSLCNPSSSSLDIYGEAVLYALTQLLELLAADTAPWMLNSPTWISEDDIHNLIWMPLQGVCWFLCCRKGFSLLGRDYGEKEEEESFELRNKEDLTPNGRVKTLHLQYTTLPVHEYFTYTANIHVQV